MDFNASSPSNGELLHSEVARVINELSETAGISLNHLASISGMSFAAIRELVRGSRQLSANAAWRLSQALKVDPAVLIAAALVDHMRESSTAEAHCCCREAASFAEATGNGPQTRIALH